MKSQSSFKAVLLLVMCTFLWGSCFPIGKEALANVHAFTVVFWRFLIASLCLLLYMKFKNMTLGTLSVTQWLWVIVVSIVGVGGLNLGLFIGLTYTSPTNGALIMALSPLFTSLMACAMQRKLPTGAQSFSILFCLLGVALVITNGHLDMLAEVKINHGDILIVAGMLAWSGYTYFSQSISRWMPVVPYTLVGMLSGLAVVSVLCLLEPGSSVFTEFFTSRYVVMSQIIYIGVFGTVAGYLLWLRGVQALGAQVASLFFNFVPVFSVLVSYLFGQTVTVVQLLGITVVIAGLLVPRLSSIQIRKTIKA